MPDNIRPSSPRERQDIYNEHFAARVASGEYLEVVESYRHPIRGAAWQWCTSSEIVVYYDKNTREQIILGQRHVRDGRCLTRNGLDPKWILFGGVIYSQP